MPPSSLVQFSASSGFSFPSLFMVIRLSYTREKKFIISSVFTESGSVRSALVGIYIFISPPAAGSVSSVIGTSMSSPSVSFCCSPPFEQPSIARLNAAMANAAILLTQFIRV